MSLARAGASKSGRKAFSQCIFWQVTSPSVSLRKGGWWRVDSEMLSWKTRVWILSTV